MTDCLLQVTDLRYAWPGQNELLFLPQLELQAGERLFLFGASGCGKSTLLSLLAGVLKPSHGSIQLLGTELAQLSASQRDRFRAEHIGLIFQQFNLIPFLSVLDNVCLPLQFSKRRKQRALTQAASLQDEALRLLADLGLSDTALLKRPARDLSIGQQQRVAAARALIGAPELLIADEPTSALDQQSRTAFIELLENECALFGSSLIFVSHDLTLASLFDRQLALSELNQAQIERCHSVT